MVPTDDSATNHSSRNSRGRDDNSRTRLANNRGMRLAVSERKTICDLGMVTVDFDRSDARTHEPGNVFRLTFRHRSGQETGRIEVHNGG